MIEMFGDFARVIFWPPRRRAAEVPPSVNDGCGIWRRFYNAQAEGSRGLLTFRGPTNLRASPQRVMLRARAPAYQQVKHSDTMFSTVQSQRVLFTGEWETM